MFFEFHLFRGFSEYVETSGEALYQKLCSEITAEFNECSKQVGIIFISFLHDYFHNVVRRTYTVLKIAPLFDGE